MNDPVQVFARGADTMAEHDRRQPTLTVFDCGDGNRRIVARDGQDGEATYNFTSEQWLEMCDAGPAGAAVMAETPASPEAPVGEQPPPNPNSEPPASPETQAP